VFLLSTLARRVLEGYFSKPDSRNGRCTFMSMNAEFVQIDATELARIKRSPAWAETLFHNGPSSMPPQLAALGQALEDRMRASGPRLMADVLSQMNPEVRKQMEARLGVTAATLASGEGGDLLVKAMEERRERMAALAPSMLPGMFSGGPGGASGVGGASGHGGAGPAEGGPAAAPVAPREKLSLDKAWHGVHYVLCGHPEPGKTPISQVVLGGTDIGHDEEGFSGYGPSRYFTPVEVAGLAESLSRPELEAEAARRFDAAKMEELEIYPGWSASQAEADRKWIMDSFRNLREFFGDAAAKGRAIVTCLV